MGCCSHWRYLSNHLQTICITFILRLSPLPTSQTYHRFNNLIWKIILNLFIRILTSIFYTVNTLKTYLTKKGKVLDGKKETVLIFFHYLGFFIFFSMDLLIRYWFDWDCYYLLRFNIIIEKYYFYEVDNDDGENL